MCLNIALQLEQVADTKDAVGGIAYDFRNCFDLIPIDLIFETMSARGMSSVLTGPLQALYANLDGVFKLKGTCGEVWQAANGLIQDDSRLSSVDDRSQLPRSSGVRNSTGYKNSRIDVQKWLQGRMPMLFQQCAPRFQQTLASSKHSLV